MPIPQSAQGIIHDARRLIAFKFEEPVDVLVFYAKDGTELKRLDHFWSIDRPRGARGANADQFTLTVIEDEDLVAPNLDSVMALVETVQYEVQVSPMVLSGHYEVKVADRPQPGKNRVWVLKATKHKFKSKYFRAAGVNSA